MEIVKRNMIAFICAAVALIAIAAWFWPVGSMYSSFQEELDKSKTTYSTIQSLSNKKFEFPRFSPTDKLNVVGNSWFPNQATIDATKHRADELKKSADEMLVTAVNINRYGHDLLEPSALPQPLGNHAYLFRAKYNAVMDRGGKPERDPTHREGPWPLNLPDEVLNSTTPPTDAEVQAARDKKWKDEYEWQINTADGREINRKEIEDKFNKDTEHFAHDFYRSKAKNFKIYMEDTALARASGLGPSATLTPTDIWFGQMTLWIDQDVCQAIRDINRDSRGIEESPVKNLMEVTLPTDMRMYVASQDLGGGTAPPPDEPSTPYYSKSPTGRVCNTMYDVVHFHMVAIVDTKQVRPFLERLRYGRMITVINLQSENVDTRSAEDQGYFYGSAPCVQLTMDCEELFMRDWTAPTRTIPGLPAPGTGPMPKEVQKNLGVPAVTTPATPSPNRVAMGQ